MKKIIVILLILLVNFSNAQSDTVFVKYNSEKFDDSLTYKTDTFMFSNSFIRNIIIGTSKLDYTHNQLEAMSYGLNFDKINFTSCSPNDYREKDKTRINKISKTDSTLSINCKIISNCCYSFLCDIEIKDDSVLNLIYYGHGSICGCTCCFGIDYQLSIEKNNLNFQKIKYVILNGDKRTRKKL